MSVQRARALRKDPTDAERRLWRELRRRQIHGYKFRRQRPIGNYVVDFVCLEKRIQACVADLPVAEQRALFHDNAVRLYRLGDCGRFGWR